MKTSVFFRILATSAFFFLFLIFAFGQDGRPGIECGCKKYDDYIKPSVKGPVVKQGASLEEGFSFNNKYRLIAIDASGSSSNNTNFSIYYKGKSVFNENMPATGWGFSPDEDRFVVHGFSSGFHWCTLVNLEPTNEGEPYEKYALITNANVSSSVISFSPNGKYLLYAAVDYQQKLFLKVFNSKTGEEVYDCSGSFLVGSPAGESVAGWGFSSDPKDATFVHAYLVDINSYALKVVNLTKNSDNYVVNSPANSFGQASFSFSPCGDYFAWVNKSPYTDPVCNLYKTDSYNNYTSVSAVSMLKLYSAENGHFIKYIDNSTKKIIDNNADEDCPDATSPKWENAVLDTGKLEGVKMKLHWSGATDASGVTAYRIYKDNKLWKEADAVTKCTVTELSPATQYKFKIEAGDETGNWSTNGPEKSFSTLPDNEPTWPDNELNFEGKTETRITLKWSEAIDDFGIEFYKIFVDDVAVDSVGTDTLHYHLKNLKAGKYYRFIVRAVDAAGQPVSSKELGQTMVSKVAPGWPDGAALSVTDRTETTLTLNWPAATDNCNAVVGYKICKDLDTLAFIKSIYHSYVVKDLEEGITYAFRVFAVDESGSLSPALGEELSTLPGYSVFPLVVAAGDQKKPDISDRYVVWWDDSKDDGDIYAYDLEKDTIIQITSDPHAQFGPAVSGERIVWTDARSGNWDIYMYDPELGEVPVCTNPASQDLPAIDGDYIVWRDSRNGDFDIYMYDIKTKTESPVSTHRAKQNWPDVSGNYVVYADDRNENWDIFMYSIFDKKETSICTNSSNQTFPVVTGKHLWDLAIAYMDDRDGDNIYVYYPNFIQGQDYEFLVPLDQYPAISGQYYPHLEDKQLVFQDKLGGAGTDWNIYAYKFRTDTYGKKTGICVDPIESANQTRPRTSKGNVVWQDERNGNSDIYIWKRPAGTDLQISLKEITDPIIVGDTLRYIVTVTNDGPGINTLIEAECTLPVMAKFVRTTADTGTATTVGNTITWKIDTLRNGSKADLEIVLVTFDLAILDFKASAKSSAFDPDPSNNEISAITKVKNFVPGYVGEGTSPSMHVEQNGRVHIVYFGNDSSLVYATRTRKGKWEYKTLESFVGGDENDMLLDVYGNIQVVMSDTRETSPVSRLYHGTLTKAGLWSKKIIAVSNIGFHSMSLKADSHNELHLVYQEARSSASSGPFIEMSTTGGVWNQPVIFSGGYDHVDMDIDKNDNLHISFYDIGIGGLGYQKKPASGGWSEPVKVEPGWRGAQLEGMVTSIFTDDLQNPHISYVGQVNNDSRENIKYAWYSGGKWNNSLVDKGYFQSAGNKVVIDPDGKANFSYINNPVFAGDVRYATNVAGPWIKQIVDENIGAIYTDMGRDQDKYTHIVYSGAYGSVYYALLPQIEYFEIDPDTLDLGLLETSSEKSLFLKLKNPLPKDIRIDSLIINDKRISFDKTSFILSRFAKDSVKLTFNQTADPWTDTYLRIWYNVPSGLFMDIPVIAKNRQPELTIDQEPIYFGAIPSGTTLIKTVKLSNTGYTDLIISSIVVQGYVILGQARPTDFSLVGHNCSTLHPGETCNIEIRFQAGSTNYQSSFLKITSNDPSTPYKQITVYGEIAYPQISYHGGDLGFCLPGQSVTKSISIENIGHQNLNIMGATLSGSDADQFSLSNPCTVIAPGDSCKMQVTLTPNRVGDFQAILTVTSNSRYNNLQNIPLTGTSSVKTLELSVNNFDFGSIHVGEQAEVLLELRNKGSVDLNVTNIKISGNDQYEFIQDHICSTIVAGAKCIDTIRFVPVFEGDKTASLAVTSNDSYNPVQTVTLEGHAGEILPLQASISAEPVTGQEPLNVRFDAVVSGGQPPYTYLWEFDDLKSSIVASPVHTFSGPGIYKVVLKLTDINNQPVSSTVEVAVSEAGIPVVLASANPVSGEIPLLVQFNSVVTGGDPPLVFLWEFRDGTTSNLQNPVHSYLTPGSYTARITITDNDGDNSRDSILIKAIWNNSLAGQIWDETGVNPILKSDAVLYPESNINDTTLLKLNGVNSYLFPGLPAAKYTVHAIPDPVAYPEDLPTYLGDNIMMYNAIWVQVSGHITGKNIKLIKKPPVTSGSGIISGNIISGSGKGLTITEKTGAVKGDPLSKVYVYLQSSTDSKLKAYDISGTDGSFSFEGLENGSYYFLADYKGKPMDATNTPLVISDTRKDIEILATVGPDKITVKDLTTDINDAILNKLKVYPVPAGDHLTLEIPEGLFSGTKIRLRILDLSGKYVFIDENVELKGSPVILDINLLKGGIYLLEAADKNISRKVKIVKMR
jgi:beta propeller repeat protein